VLLGVAYLQCRNPTASLTTHAMMKLLIELN